MSYSMLYDILQITVFNKYIAIVVLNKTVTALISVWALKNNKK